MRGSSIVDWRGDDYTVNSLVVSFILTSHVMARFLKSSSVYLNSLRCASTRLNAIGNKSLVAGVTQTDDKSTFVAWHPDVPFPYELSKPIPKKVEVNCSAVIEESAMRLAKKAFKTTHPEVARQELQRLTFTTKHKWYPRARDRKAKDTPMDRPYL